ncbi:uncharacterized protein PGTG_18397 [Puccinia graminis f. sp. tritici CRL 75-36-700-3]|uniref:Zn(2)-C6 fungal-type domain-containing protein n=1 Tax=Puccinia graminis f. sp. tritici (strain CRL 75-36-700-3 / race SCCL) TaxID=418459 RepID=E3L5X1_PUCGT|nr:uncharacterized protein PGTG_18397 [Puccinia graminis f. sp. tritici CRL 75-36-700-3]EFP91946.2 hypothetical protein PGTG_18397 [Puccinia graminis f. sp. tritici CRL 75-36-700-3]
MDSIIKSESVYPAFSEPKIPTTTNLPTPPKRRPRHRLSCAECRRLKLKCDRTWPCSSCTKRGCARICPDGTLQSKVRTKDTSVLLARISELENLLQRQDHQLRLSCSNDRPGEHQSTSQPSSSEYAPMGIVGSSSEQPQDTHVLALIDGIGTLNVSDDGRSRFLGLSASSAFFDGDWSDCDSLSSTPGTSEDPNETSDSPSPFTFQALLGRPALDPNQLKTYLPERHEAERAWARFSMKCTMSIATKSVSEDWHYYTPYCTSLSVLFDPTVQALHPDARKWHDAAETCLRSTDYLASPSLAIVQAIHAMGTYVMNSRADGAETFWPVLGTAMRLCQSMGLHRDGSNWGLQSSELESRRRTFHEILSMDRLQSLVLGRPYAISDKHFDTSIPRFDLNQPTESHEPNVDFHVAKWRFSSYIGRVVDDAFSVSPPSLAVVNRLDEELRQFDRALSPKLKCSNTPPICQGPSWCDMNPVERKSGSDGSIDLQLTMQQHFMTALQNTTLLFLHRRAFALALSEATAEPLNSPFSKSVLSVIIESSRNLVSVAQAAQALYPELANRWWYLFCHAYNGATCVVTLLIKSPGCILGKHAWSTLATAMSVFSTAAQFGPICRDLFNRLSRLHKQAMSALSADLLPNPHQSLSMHSYHPNQTLVSPNTSKMGEGSMALAHYLESSNPYLHHNSSDFPCELGASTRLTRKNRTQSVSNSSVASGRVSSLTSSCRSRGTSFGSTGPNEGPSAPSTIGIAANGSQGLGSNRNGSSRSPNDNNGMNSTLTTSFNMSSWAGLVNSPRDEFDEEESNEPPCWENLSIEPTDEAFNTPIFGVSHSQSNHYFEGFTEHFHPPMVLPSNDAMLSPGPSNYSGIYGPMPNPSSFDNNPNHPPVSSNHNQQQDTSATTEGMTSPINTQFDLLDTFLTW